MSRDLRGPDLSMVTTDAVGAPVFELSKGIESFSCKPVYLDIEANNLDGLRVGQDFNGYEGEMTLNMQNTRCMAFADDYHARLRGGEEFRVTINQRVYDPEMGTRNTWVYSKCTLKFDEGPWQKGSSVKVKVSWKTGQDRTSM